MRLHRRRPRSPRHTTPSPIASEKYSPWTDGMSRPDSSAVHNETLPGASGPPSRGLPAVAHASVRVRPILVSEGAVMVVPVSIKVFLAFSAALSLLELTTLVPALIWLKQTTVPFTGWGGNMPFFFACGSWPGLFKGAGYSIDASTFRRYLTG